MGGGVEMGEEHGNGLGGGGKWDEDGTEGGVEKAGNG